MMATRIRNLHQANSLQQKGRIMSTTTADPGQAQSMSRRKTDDLPPTGRQLSFNPLHPSMELPPEQLIRLLGLENKTKKRRKKRPAQVAARSRPNSTASAGKQVKLRLPETPPASAERERDTAALPFGEPRRNLLVTSLITGAIIGAGVSAYLFWSSPDDTTPAVTHTAPAPKAGTTTRPTAAVGSRGLPAVPPAVAPAPEEASRQGTVKRATIISPAAIEAEEKRLRNEAEKRLAERILQTDTHIEPEAPGSDAALPTEIEATADMRPDTPHDAVETDPLMMNKDELHTATPADDATPPEPVVTDTLSSPVERVTPPVEPGEEQSGTTVAPESAIQQMPANSMDSEATPAEAAMQAEIAAETERVVKPVIVDPAEADAPEDGATTEAVSGELF
jgi:hypothetical protein